jgi:hypothetical protein
MRELELKRRSIQSVPVARRVGPDPSIIGAAAAVLGPLQRSAGNRAVADLLSGGRAHPPLGAQIARLQRFETGTHDTTVALSDQQVAQLTRFPGAALSRWSRLTQDQRDSVYWKMLSLYGPDFTADFQSYANGSKAPNISTYVSNDPRLTPEVLTARGYRSAGSIGGIPTWVHPSGHEVHLLSKGTPGPGPVECDDPNMGTACLTDSDDEDSCNDCCEQQYADKPACRSGCRAGCANKI